MLELHPCRSQTNQTFIHGRDSRITIGGLCVDAFTPGRNYVQPGDQVGLYGCHNGTNQRWTEKYTNDLTSRYFVVGRNGQELCLERAGQLADGAKLVVNTCTMVENQKWYFTGGVGKR